MARRLGPGGIALLRQWEQGPHGGCALTPYQGKKDPPGVLTIGLGHVITGREPFDCSRGITEAQADELLVLDTAEAAAEVETHVTVPLNQNQFDALTCLTFNIGRHGFDTSTLLRELDAGDYADVPAQIARWDRANGVVVHGLDNRRAAEIALWETPCS